jgi:hypothetical protein
MFCTQHRYQGIIAKDSVNLSLLFLLLVTLVTCLTMDAQAQERRIAQPILQPDQDLTQFPPSAPPGTSWSTYITPISAINLLDSYLQEILNTWGSLTTLDAQAIVSSEMGRRYTVLRDVEIYQRGAYNGGGCAALWQQTVDKFNNGIRYQGTPESESKRQECEKSLKSVEAMIPWCLALEMLPPTYGPPSKEPKETPPYPLGPIPGFFVPAPAPQRPMRSLPIPSQTETNQSSASKKNQDNTEKRPSSPILPLPKNNDEQGCPLDPTIPWKGPFQLSATKNVALQGTQYTDYRKIFLDAYPAYRPFTNFLEVHHAVPQIVMTMHPELFTWGEIHSLPNLRGICKPDRIHATITALWVKWFRSHLRPTRQSVISYALEIDMVYGKMYYPRLPVGR